MITNEQLFLDDDDNNQVGKLEEKDDMNGDNIVFLAKDVKDNLK